MTHVLNLHFMWKVRTIVSYGTRWIIFKKSSRPLLKMVHPTPMPQITGTHEELDGVLDNAYRKVLDEAFTNLPGGAFLVYLNMGDDTTPAEVADQKGHHTLATSDHSPSCEITKLQILSSQIEDYRTLKLFIKNPQNAALLSNSHDMGLGAGKFNELLGDFNGQYIFHFENDLKSQSPGTKMLENHPNYGNATSQFLTREQISLMRNHEVPVNLNIYERLKR